MDMNILNQYLQISKINLKHNFLPQFLLSVLIILITPIIFGINNLSSSASWTPLEMFVSLIGIVLLVPVFIPEQNYEIADVVGSKFTSTSFVYIVRMIYSIAALIIFISLFCMGMKICGSEIYFLHISGTIATSIFLGSLGIFALALSNSVIVSYMIPLIYYIINFMGAKKLGNFYLFSGMNGSFNEKAWLFFSGISIIGVSLLLKHIIQKNK